MKSHRLWLRLKDVLPLAEHAMACPAHRVTGAQTLAGAALRPALVWAGTPARDVLVSNGVPVWYGERGAPHAADAHTWRHTPTGRYGTAWRDGYDNAYLPLDAGAGQLPVIDMLRRARHTGRHWVTVDIDPTDGHLIRPEQVRVAEYRTDLIPPDGEWMAATVTSTAVAGGSYPALLPDGYTSNAGHQLPRFDRPTVEQMIADLDGVHANPDRTSDPMPGEYPHLRFTGHVLVVFDEHDDGEHVTYRETDRVHPDAEGRYPLGAHTWPWQLTA
ncbi:hypothetical protein [Micromonospora tulbaghiae]|uniref:hypothetical protein n=1 Tax=Micromonospora tulbaghiae TaxID=479978 RepID=UPI003EB80081